MRLYLSDGQAFVEAAIVVPMAFFLLFFIYETTLALTAKNLIELGTFRAARTFISTDNKIEAEKAYLRSISPIATFPQSRPFHFIEISTSKEGAVSISTVYFYKPIFPLFYFSKLLYATIVGGKTESDNFINKAITASGNRQNNTIPIYTSWKLKN